LPAIYPNTFLSYPKAVNYTCHSSTYVHVIETFLTRYVKFSRYSLWNNFNPLNAVLNPICNLLVLLGDLNFMGPCIVSILKYACISNKMQRYTIYLYLETPLHISGGTSAHHQEGIELCLQNLVVVTPLLLSAAIVEELERVWVCCGWRTPPTAHSNRFQLFHDSGR
jgi:hypothetical protein